MLPVFPMGITDTKKDICQDSEEVFGVSFGFLPSVFNACLLQGVGRGARGEQTL